MELTNFCILIHITSFRHNSKSKYPSLPFVSSPEHKGILHVESNCCLKFLNSLTRNDANACSWLERLDLLEKKITTWIWLFLLQYTYFIDKSCADIRYISLKDLSFQIVFGLIQIDMFCFSFYMKGTETLVWKAIYLQSGVWLLCTVSLPTEIKLMKAFRNQGELSDCFQQTDN